MQDALQVVVVADVGGVGLEVGGLLGVHGEHVADVGVAQEVARVQRDEVRLVPDVQRAEVGKLVEPLLELRVPDLGAAEHDGGHRDVRVADLGHAVHHHVERAERGQRRAEAVAGAHDAEALADFALVLGDKLAHCGQQLVARAVLGEGRPLVAGGVDDVPPFHDARVAAGRVGLRQDGVGRDQVRLEHVHPLQVPDGAAQRHVDDTLARGGGRGVRGHGHVADPVGLLAPGLAGERVHHEPRGERRLGGRVEVGGHGNVGRGGELRAAEERRPGEAARAAVLGVGVGVEGVVGHLAEVAAEEDEAAERQVQRVKEAVPVGGAQQLGPRRGGAIGAGADQGAGQEDALAHVHCARAGAGAEPSAV